MQAGGREEQAGGRQEAGRGQAGGRQKGSMRHGGRKGAELAGQAMSGQKEFVEAGDVAQERTAAGESGQRGGGAQWTNSNLK